MISSIPVDILLVLVLFALSIYMYTFFFHTCYYYIKVKQTDGLKNGIFIDFGFIKRSIYIENVRKRNGELWDPDLVHPSLFSIYFSIYFI